MLCQTDTPAQGPWGHPAVERDPRCEGCGRSLVLTDGDDMVPPAERPSCEADFKREACAGKITMDGEVVHFHFPDDERPAN